MPESSELDDVLHDIRACPKGGRFAANTRKYLKLVRELRRRDSENVAVYGSQLLRNHRSLLPQEELWQIHEQVAVAAMDVKSMDLAFSLVQAVRKRFSDSARAERLTGMYFEGKGQLKEANEVYSRFQSEFPDHELLEKRKVAMERAKGNTVGAIGLLQKYVDTNQMDKDAWEELADLYLQGQMYAQAAHCLEELLLHQPSSISYLVQYADILYTMGGASSSNYKTALTYYSAAIETSEGQSVRALYGACACAAQMAGAKARSQSAQATQPELATLAGRQPVKKRKRTEERVSTPNGWPQHPTASADTPIHRAPGSFPRGDLGHPPGTKKSKASPAHPQISPRDPFAAPGQPSIKPRLTVKNSGSTPLPRPDWSSQQPGSGAGSLTAKVGSAPPSKQQKGLKSKKKPAPEFSQHQPVSPDANGFVKREGQEQDGLQRPKLKVKQPQGSHQPAPTLSETGLSEPSASAATEDDAAYQQEKPLGAAPLSNLAAAELRPDIPITRQDVTRVLDRVQQKDWYEIFKEPVTDDVAPGYSEKIARPMDFKKIRAQLDAGFYKTWDSLMEDMETMFNNAMIYNTDDTVYHQQAKSLLDITRQTIGYARKGIKDMRGRTAGSVRKHNAQFVANEKADRDARRLAARATKQAARNAKMAELAAASGLALPADMVQARPDALGGAERDGFGERAAVTRARDAETRRQQLLDENVRMTYCPKSKDPVMMRWHSLAGGASGEGACYGKGMAVRSCVHSVAPPRDAYTRSIALFAAGLSGKARKMALARTARCMPSDAAKSAATALPRPAVIPSAQSSLRQSWEQQLLTTHRRQQERQATASARSTLHYHQALSDLKQTQEARQDLLGRTKEMHRHAHEAAAVRLQTQLDEQLEDLLLEYEQQEALQSFLHDQALMSKAEFLCSSLDSGVDPGSMQSRVQVDLAADLSVYNAAYTRDVYRAANPAPAPVPISEAVPGDSINAAAQHATTPGMEQKLRPRASVNAAAPAWPLLSMNQMGATLSPSQDTQAYSGSSAHKQDSPNKHAAEPQTVPLRLASLAMGHGRHRKAPAPAAFQVWPQAVDPSRPGGLPLRKPASLDGPSGALRIFSSTVRLGQPIPEYFWSSEDDSGDDANGGQAGAREALPCASIPDQHQNGPHATLHGHKGAHHLAHISASLKRGTQRQERTAKRNAAHRGMSSRGAGPCRPVPTYARSSEEDLVDDAGSRRLNVQEAYVPISQPGDGAGAGGNGAHMHPDRSQLHARISRSRQNHVRKQQSYQRQHDTAARRPPDVRALGLRTARLPGAIHPGSSESSADEFEACFVEASTLGPTLVACRAPPAISSGRSPHIRPGASQGCAPHQPSPICTEREQGPSHLQSW
ncbi:hypothetical protein WJX84_003356 [Apatococcus fuscideae]|uniref:Bromo domain-containing protein n=1 Tax=Apatococcus fuscideae TaxID=2026836 RepID=A0AAW1T538_9CHLO